MSLNSCVRAPSKKVFELNQGSNEPMFIRIFRSGRILNLQDLTDVVFSFIGVDHQKVQVSLGEGVTIESAPDGVLKVLLSMEQRALLKVEDRQSFAAQVTLGTEIREIRFEDCLDVIASKC